MSHVWDAIGFTALLGVVTFRVVEFAIFDSIFDTPRSKVYGYLTARVGSPPKQKRWRTFLMELITCPVCLSVWVAAGAVGLTLLWTDIPMPVWVWLGATVISVGTWRHIDPNGEHELTVELKKADD